MNRLFVVLGAVASATGFGLVDLAGAVQRHHDTWPDPDATGFLGIACMIVGFPTFGISFYRSMK